MHIPRPPRGIIFEQSTLLDPKNRLTEGAGDCLRLLMLTGIKRCVIGDVEPKNLLDLMAAAMNTESFSPKDYFDLIQSPKDEKGDTLCQTVRGLKELGVAQGEIVVMGNNTESLRRAEAANLGFVAVTNGAQRHEDFVQTNLIPDLIVPNLNGMRTFFRVPRTSVSF